MEEEIEEPIESQIPNGFEWTVLNENQEFTQFTQNYHHEVATDTQMTDIDTSASEEQRNDWITKERKYEFNYNVSCIEIVGDKIIVASENGDLLAYYLTQGGPNNQLKLLFTKKGIPNSQISQILAINKKALYSNNKEINQSNLSIDFDVSLRQQRMRCPMVSIEMFERKVKLFDVAYDFQLKAESEKFHTFINKAVQFKQLLMVSTLRTIYALSLHSMEKIFKFKVDINYCERFAISCVECIEFDESSYLFAGGIEVNEKYMHSIIIWQNPLNEDKYLENILESTHQKTNQENMIDTTNAFFQQVQDDSQMNELDNNQFDINDDLNNFDIDEGWINQTKTNLIKKKVQKIIHSKKIQSSHFSKISMIQGVRELNKIVSLSLRELNIWQLESNTNMGQLPEIVHIFSLSLKVVLYSSISLLNSKQLLVFIRSSVLVLDLDKNEVSKCIDVVDTKNSNNIRLQPMSSIQYEYNPTQPLLQELYPFSKHYSFSFTSGQDYLLPLSIFNEIKQFINHVRGNHNHSITLSTDYSREFSLQEQSTTNFMSIESHPKKISIPQIYKKQEQQQSQRSISPHSKIRSPSPLMAKLKRHNSILSPLRSSLKRQNLTLANIPALLHKKFQGNGSRNKYSHHTRKIKKHVKYLSRKKLLNRQSRHKFIKSQSKSTLKSSDMTNSNNSINKQNSTPSNSKSSHLNPSQVILQSHASSFFISLEGLNALSLWKISIPDTLSKNEFQIL